ncbi:MAG TPA: RNase P subunit p30 family protein [archaeon]|nr:RNase P subunit p30 family protein [archaeon]
MNLNLIRHSSLEEALSLAPKFKDNALIVCKDFAEQELKDFNKLKRKNNVEIFSCKIFQKKDQNALQKFKKICDFTAVQGGSVEMHSWACSQKIDLLIDPFNAEKNCIDLATCNVLRENNTFVCFTFSAFLQARGFRQTQLLKNASLALGLLEKAKTPVLFVSGAMKKEELRAAKDLSSFGVFLGMKKNNAIDCVKRNPELFLERLK